MRRLVCLCLSSVLAVQLFSQPAIAARVAQWQLEGAPESTITANNIGNYGKASKAWFHNSNLIPSDEPISMTGVNDCLWCQIVCVYQNGFLIGNSIQIDSAGAITAPFLIDGVNIGSTPTACFIEFIDEVQLYDPELKPNKVQNLFKKHDSVVLEPVTHPR
jgi:hypothetical protein